MLDYTGHPLLDVGLATLTAFARKDHPCDLTEADLQQAADYMARHYVVDPLKSFLTVAFPNSGFTQPAFKKHPEKRAQYARRVLFDALDAPPAASRDPFTQTPAAQVPFDIKDVLPPGRAFRQHVPLLTGEGYINFHPYGDAGLPLSGETLLAFQALPLGCAKVSGRLLAVHSEDPGLMLHFASTFLAINQRHVKLASAAGQTKLPDTSLYQARTLLIGLLTEALRERRRHTQENAPPPELTAYYFSNAGQNPQVIIFPLPLEVSDFLGAALSPVYRPAWDQLVVRAWQLTRPRRGQEEAPPPRYNCLYEDLFALPQDAARFIRRYFLRRPAPASAEDDDPSRCYDTRQEAALLSWQLTDLFLRKVVHMDRERIEHIRALGDALAGYIVTQNDRRLLNDLLLARNYAQVRAALIKASQAEVKRGHPPLITLDRFLAVFEQAEGLPHLDWRLGRDLVLIRLFEQLYQRGWLQQHADELDTPPDLEDAE